MKFGSYIRKIRENSSLSLKEVSDKLSWSVVYLSDIERGRRNPPNKEKMKELSEILGVPYNELLDYANKEKDHIELETVNKSENVTDLAYALARSWDKIDDNIANDIKKELSKIK